MPFNPFATGRCALLCSLMLLLPLGSAWGQRLDRGRAARMLERSHVSSQFIVKFRDVEQAPERAVWWTPKTRHKNGYCLSVGGH